MSSLRGLPRRDRRGGPDAGGEEGARGFALAAPEAGAPLACSDVRGFDEAVQAALDPRAPTPPRLVLVAPAEETAAWLSTWAEDSAQVRRTLAIRRLADAAEVIVVATLVAHGARVETALAVESVAPPPRGAARPVMRSGVYSRAFIDSVTMAPSQAAPTPSVPAASGETDDQDAADVLG